MQGVYNALVQSTSFDGSKPVMYITAPSTKVIEILGIYFSNANQLTAEQLEAYIGRVTSLGTPSANTITPAPTEPGSSAASATVKGPVTANVPTISTYLLKEAFNNLSGWDYSPIPEERIIIPAGGTIMVGITSGIVNTFTLDACVTFREIG